LFRLPRVASHSRSCRHPLEYFQYPPIFLLVTKFVLHEPLCRPEGRKEFEEKK